MPSSGSLDNGLGAVRILLHKYTFKSCQDFGMCSIIKNNAQLCANITDKRYEMSRSELREHIFRMLFRIEFNSEEEMKEQEEFYFEELEEATGKDQEYILEK